jgi:4-alpha-glucanotransferase
MIGRIAAVVVPLFSLNSAHDLGRGDNSGLIEMGDLARGMGFRLIQLLPVDETAPGELSPYSATSVAAFDPCYIALDELAGIDAAALAEARTATRGQPFDPFRHRATHLKFLEAAFEHSQKNTTTAERSAEAQFAQANADWLPDYALFRALKEKYHWASWHEWPDGLRRREPRALADATGELANPIIFYSWLQFIAHRQWSAIRSALAARGVMLGGDMAFSPGHESAEVWTNQELFDLQRTVGAPPDAFSPTGQKWGLPMPNWAKMHERGYIFMRMRVRRASQLYDLLRIDHVVGLYRTYSYGLAADSPGQFYPAAEPEQLAHGEAVMSAIKDEAGQMAIIAEDLGDVPPFVRKSLTRFGIPGYKVMRWEKDWEHEPPQYVRPAAYPELSLATSGTHDTEPLAEWWRELPPAERLEFATTLQLDGLDCGAPKLDDRGVDAILGSLYAAPSRYAFVPIQDAFGWEDRLNTPGTLSIANWTWRLPFQLEKAIGDPAVMARAAALKALAIRSRRDSA